MPNVAICHAGNNGTEYAFSFDKIQAAARFFDHWSQYVFQIAASFLTFIFHKVV